jgi:glycopeptide antibiotics resistance protein
MGKILSRGLLVLYLVTLTWVVLFKLTFNISRVLNYHHRSLNLVPFGASKIVNGRIDFGEIILNCVFFIPFGLLLNVNFKKADFLSKLSCILLYSVAAELIQYIFAIGATDITDVISNTAGGFLGLILYNLSNKYIKTEKLDRIIISAGIFLFVLAMSMQISHFFLRHHHQ